MNKQKANRKRAESMPNANNKQTQNKQKAITPLFQKLPNNNKKTNNTTSQTTQPPPPPHLPLPHHEPNQHTYRVFKHQLGLFSSRFMCIELTKATQLGQSAPNFQLQKFKQLPNNYVNR